MKTAAICVFNNRPWAYVIQKAVARCVSDEMETTLFDGYPPEDARFDFLFLAGVRPVAKLNLDGARLRQNARFVVDFGDVPTDPRVNIEDIYFYFYENGPPHAAHYRRLPKFVFDDVLYPEQDDDIITVFVDHFLDRHAYQHLVAEQLRRCPYPLRVYYQSKDGIVENPDDATLTSAVDSRTDGFKIIPFDEIAPFYRKTHIFMPTHRETQGMVAMEIGACGGLTYMTPGTYPEQVTNTFSHVLYNEQHPIDWNAARDLVNPDNRRQFRDVVIKNFGFAKLKDALLGHLRELDGE